MPAPRVPLDHQYVLNFATRTLARVDGRPRHDYGQYDDPTDLRARLCEAWRFPIVDTHRDPALDDGGAQLNRVTFVHADSGNTACAAVAVIGTFATLHEPVPLERVQFLGEDTAYRAATVVVPKGQVHRYKLLVGDAAVLDPINPQRVRTPDGETWSRFFTDLCTQPLVLDRRELILLERLTDHILPFRTADGQRFLQTFYAQADLQTKDTQYATAFRLDQPVGVVNFIDKLLAREEAHHLVDYRICLRQIDAILRRRHPGTEPALMPKESFADLYDQMGAGGVDGWQYDVYGEPAYFLKLLRRHTYTGAFSHPGHGGNVGAAGWAYLEETYRDAAGASCFAWRKALARPLGLDPGYYG